MSLRRLLLAGIASVFLAAGIACDDPLSPGDVAGVYVLRSLRGESLPAVLWETGTYEARLLADTLRLRGDGSGTEVWLYEEGRTGLPTQSRRADHLFGFQVHDGRLEGFYQCPPETICLGIIEPIRGVFTPDGLRLDIARHGEGPIEFERIDLTEIWF